jgi:acyl-CoA synthetase (AMP-forming)/AMP-acid ligase II
MAAIILAGCSSVPIPPTYTQDELKAICERNGFRWYPDELVGGFCERR